MSPRKIREIARLIRGKDAKTSLATLMLTRRRAADEMAKVLRQAIANANNQGIGGKLKIDRLEVGEGPRLKRFRPVSRGMAHSIIKPTAHIKMELMPVAKPAAAAKPKVETKTAKIQEAEVVETKAETKETKPKTKVTKPKTNK